MNFGPRRGHVMFIFERFFRDFGLLLLYLVVYLVVRDVQILLDNIALAFIAFFMPVKRSIEYLTTYYTIDHEKLQVKSGLLKKEVQEIPLANITTVDFTQPVIFQLTKVYSVNVENAGGIGGGDSGNVKMVLKEEDAITAKRMLLAHQNLEELPEAKVESPIGENTYMASNGEIIMMGLLQAKTLVIIAQLFAYVSIAAGFFSNYLENMDDAFFDEKLLPILESALIPIIIGTVVFLYLFSLVVGACIAMIKCYRFRVTDRGKSLFVEYGFFTKKTHTIMKEKISCLEYRQSLPMRLINRGTLMMVAAASVTMDDEVQEETVMLYPVIKDSQLYEFLEKVLPGMAEPPEYEKAPKCGLPYFFICGRVITALILTVLALVFTGGTPVLRQGALIVTGIILMMAVVSVFLEYGNSAVSPYTKMMALRSGGFTRSTILLERNKIEYAEDSGSNRKRRRAGVSSITVGVLAPNQYSTHKVRNMDLSVFEAIKGRLLY